MYYQDDMVDPDSKTTIRSALILKDNELFRVRRDSKEKTMPKGTTP